MSFYAKTVAHWPMNDNAASATVIDAMGNYNGTYTDKDGNINTSTGTSTGKIGGALDFDGPQADGGTDEYIDTGDTFQSVFQDSFSISIWVKPTDGRPPSTGFFLGTAMLLESDAVKMMVDNAGGLKFQYNSNGNKAELVSSEQKFSDGQQTWHHLVMVFDDTIRAIGGVRMYYDGVLEPFFTIKKGDTTNVVAADYVSDRSLYIGGEHYATPTNFYNGIIDNVMFFNVALSADEVKRIYNNGHGTEILAELDEQRTARRGTSPHGLRGRYEH